MSSHLLETSTSVLGVGRTEFYKAVKDWIHRKVSHTTAHKGWLEGIRGTRKAKRTFSLENGRLQSDLITASHYWREPTRKQERNNLQERAVTGQEGMAKIGWDFELPGLVDGGPAHDRPIGTRLSLGSLPNQAICDPVKIFRVLAPDIWMSLKEL